MIIKAVIVIYFIIVYFIKYYINLLIAMFKNDNYNHGKLSCCIYSIKQNLE